MISDSPKALSAPHLAPQSAYFETKFGGNFDGYSASPLNTLLLLFCFCMCDALNYNCHSDSVRVFLALSVNFVFVLMVFIVLCEK